jgi:Holliday junction resolvase RusA-like endonuclease
MNTPILGPVFVRGLPAPFATTREVAWKESVAQQVESVWQGKPYIESACEVTLLFRLPHDKAEETDIDNLLKPAIDAIGSVLFRPARRGHQVRRNADDNWIYRLVAEKAAGPSDERVGMEVTVSEFQAHPR